MPGYGEDTWYDASDHTELHAAIQADPAAARTAISRRPALERSVDACLRCAELLLTTAAAHTAPAEPAAELIHARFSLQDLQDLLLPAVNLGPGHQLVALYTEQASVLSLVVRCPDGEAPHAPAHAAA